MALEPAGVSLEAEGFVKYLKQLEDIDKKQQEVFDTKFKDTRLSFNKATKAAKDYKKELNDLAKAERRAKDEAKKLAVAQKTAAATQRQAALSTVNAALQIAKAVGQAAFELGKLGATFESQETGLNNLAASFGQSGAQIQAAIQTASRGTVSGLRAIQAANQGLLLGVAKTPAEFDRLTRTALTLGRTMGLTGTQAIEQFTTALGRRSLLILDNFGISAKAVNAEIERLALADFGVANSQLNEAQKNATFMKAALTIAGDAAAAIGEDSGKAAESFERMAASSENLKVQTGLLLKDLDQSLGITKGIANVLDSFAAGLAGLRVDLGFGDTRDEIASLELEIRSFQKVRATIAQRLESPNILSRLFTSGASEEELSKLDQTIAKLQSDLERLNLQAVVEDEAKIAGATQNANNSLQDQEDTLKANESAIKALSQAVQQAEQLQLSFARAAEDAALALARQNEDVARNTARQVAKLEENQAKDRADLLDDQIKELEKFNKNAAKQIANAEKDIAKERKKAQEDIRQAQEDAARDRIRAQERLQRELKQAADRFNLSQLQSERRFQLSEERLRAEGDILALQRLREDQELARQEEKENFALQQKETKDNAKDSAKDQEQDLEDKVKQINQDAKERIGDLKANLEQQRAELLANFDQQILDQQVAQEEARVEQQRGFDEQAEDRAIALQRQEEDRRISEQRQLEDLGRSLANQKDVTAEGAKAIAEEIEKVFGVEGVADAIFDGFTDRTESTFTELFNNVADIVSDAVASSGLPPDVGGPGRIGGIPQFHDGGVVPGPAGSPQIIQALGKETILPTHKQNFIMPAPVVPSQTLSVEMSGGFNISGGESASSDVIEDSVKEMTETAKIAIGRIARRTNI